jgi:3-hydroxyacyl-[acyl-carrier-protein] dehydratase
MTGNNYLPHGEAFLFLDEVKEATQNEITGFHTFRKSHEAFIAYPTLETVPSFFILEALFQCGGARILNTCDSFFGIAKIDSSNFLAQARFDEQVHFMIQNNHLSKKIIKQSGKAYVNNELILDAQWVSIKLSLEV